MDVLTGLGLATASGLNAWIPVFLLGVTARLTSAVELPQAWQWLTDPVALAVLGVLVALEFVADKVPVVSQVNNVVQTLVRPTSGGVVVAAGGGLDVTDASRLVQEGDWVPVAAGAGLALAIHLGKWVLRAGAETVTFGLATPLLGAAEDAGAVALVITALLAPVLVVLVLGALLFLAVRVVWLVRVRRASRSGPAVAGGPPGA